MIKHVIIFIVFGLFYLAGPALFASESPARDATYNVDMQQVFKPVKPALQAALTSYRVPGYRVPSLRNC